MISFEFYIGITFNMLSQKYYDSHQVFIKSIEVGLAGGFDFLTYSAVDFSVRYYEDCLFDFFCIPFPEGIKLATLKRKAEYLATRYAAKIALQKHGCNSLPFLGADRAPVWPIGWKGSISHSNESGIVLIAPTHSGINPGVDVEYIPPHSMAETADVFSSRLEQELIKASDIDYEMALLIVFSAKESLYKSLYPVTRTFFDFDAVSVCYIDTQKKVILLTLNKTISTEYRKGKKITCHYIIFVKKIITFVAKL